MGSFVDDAQAFFKQDDHGQISSQKSAFSREHFGLKDE